MLNNIFGSKHFTLVTIGDTVIDAFIRLKEAHLTCKLNNTDCEICMKYGDKIPFEFVEICNAVGNSANAAVSASRLGINTAIITNLGNDSYANDCINEFKKQRVSTALIKKQKGKKTNYHYVLWYAVDRTILIKHEDFAYSLPEHKTDWLYLSSLGEKTLAFHQEIASYLEAHPQTKLVFQPGTYQIRFGVKALSTIYKHTEIFFCNKEEAQKILETNENNIKLLMQKINELGPKIVVLTDGPNGAYAYHEDKAYFMPPYPDTAPPLERTGAGDAYASTFTSAIILGQSIEEALKWAGVNSMSVVQKIGAQNGLLSRVQLEEFLKKAPADYKVKEI